MFLYYGNPAASSTVDATILSNTGIRFLTRRQTIDPTSLASYFSEFDSAASPSGYGCAVLPDHVSRSNANVFGSGVNAHYSLLFVLDVPASQAGTWGLRFGADFGFGGGAYARGVVLEEQWNDDLWWAGNFAAASEVLQGSVTLSAGRHLLAVYGSEGCCEGASTLQLRPPGGAWTDLRTSNFAITAPSCPLPSVATARVADVAGLVVGKTSAVQSDPFNGTTNPKAIPGARVRYTIRVGNGDAAQIIDSNSIVVVDPVPAGTSLFVGDINGPGSGPVRFIDSVPASGVGYVFSGLGSTTDSLAFSNDGGATFGYTPTPDGNGVDDSVTHLRITATGQPSCNATPTVRNFELQFDVRVP
ncbi:MAG: CCXG family PEP-CTERM protein [Steroidobacteraceae bacterium]